MEEINTSDDIYLDTNKIYILEDLNSVSVDYWFGPYRFGRNKIEDVSSSATLRKLFFSLNQGVSEDSDLIISDVFDEKYRKIFLAHIDDKSLQNKIGKELRKVSMDWGVKNIGVYFNPKAVTNRYIFLSLLALFLNTENGSKPQEIFFYKGEHSREDLIDLLIRVKSSLNEKGIDCQIYH